MAKKLDKTLADYVVGGVMPALLIGLLVSLCFFLLELAVSGQNVGQLKWVLFFFIVGTVLIARIAMRGDIAERAGVYGIALAIAAGLALVRFVEIPQTALGGFGWLIPISLMCIIWWSAHKLTLDSTWDEDTEPEETGGLFDATPPEPEPAKEQPGKKDWFGRYEADRLAEQEKKKPGLVMVYFSLAALPLFGVGQAMLPAADVERRQYAFWLLTLYVACGLGLLLTTSFLGLRRYLRGRRLQMPAAMTGLWLGLGAALIVSLMVLSAYFLPRPEAEYHFSHLIGWAGSKERDANRHHVFEGSTGRNNEGASGGAQKQQQQQQGKGNQGNQRQDQRNQQQDRQGEGRSGEKMAGGQRGDPTRGNQQQSGQGKEKQGQRGEPGDGGRGGQGKDGQGKQGSQAGSKSGEQGQGGAGGNQKTGQKQPGQRGEQNPEGKGGGQTKDKEGDRGNQKQDQGAQGDNSPDKPEKDRRNPPEAGEQEKKNEDREGGREGQNEKQQQDEGSGDSQQQPPPPPPQQQETSQWSWDWLKWVIYGLMIAGLIFALWKWGRQIWNALMQMWIEFLAWWYGLFKGKKDDAAEDEALADEEARLPPQPFAWFSNPLLSPNRFKSMEEMIRYSFAALHSWGYEQGLGRQPDETPTEFAQRLGLQREKAYPDIRKLTDLYAVVTYARTKPPSSSEAILRNFWNRLYEEQPRQLVVN